MSHEISKRLSLLEGDWTNYLYEHMGQRMSQDRISQMGKPSLAINLFRSVVTSLSTQYNEGIYIVHPVADTSLLEDMYSRHQKLNQYVLALRDSAVAVTWNGSKLVSRIVTPDNLEAIALIDDPTVPVYLKECRERLDPRTDKVAEFYDVYDLGIPSFQILDRDGNDVTEVFMEVQPYPYVYENVPFIPYTIYHASESNSLFNSYEWSELVDASLDLARDWNEWWVMFRDSSYRIKYMLDLQVAGTEMREGDSTVGRVPISHNTLLNLNTSGTTTGSIGVLESSVELKEVAEAIEIHTRAIMSTLGLHGLDVTKISPESGVALSIRRDSIRELSRAYSKQFEKGDYELLNLGLKILSISGITLPIDDYLIVYPRPPYSVEELNAKLDYLTKLLNLNLITVDDMKNQLGL